MGLDITAYKNLKLTDIPADEDLETDGNYTMLYPEQSPDVVGDLTSDYFYEYEDSMGFNAGSYSGYNNWRNDLARLAGYPLEQYKGYFDIVSESHCVACWNGAKGPFSELINFSDCDGIIGTEVAKKLAKDFADFQEKANTFEAYNFWLEKYNYWRKAFEMASENGAVVFH